MPQPRVRDVPVPGKTTVQCITHDDEDDDDDDDDYAGAEPPGISGLASPNAGFSARPKYRPTDRVSRNITRCYQPLSLWYAIFPHNSPWVGFHLHRSVSGQTP